MSGKPLYDMNTMHLKIPNSAVSISVSGTKAIMESAQLKFESPWESQNLLVQQYDRTTVKPSPPDLGHPDKKTPNADPPTSERQRVVLKLQALLKSTRK